MKNIKNHNLWVRPYIPNNRPNYCWDIKGWLIFFNLALDQLIADVTPYKWHVHSIIYIDSETALEKCVLALEDRHFYTHKGIDYRFIARIFRQLFTGKRLGGVSTIEQQYVRTFLNRRERTFGRKFNEWILAWLLSHRVNKQDILRAYLCSAYFGYRNNGCDQISQTIFGFKAAKLNHHQAALIASMLVYPLPKRIRNERNFFPVTDVYAFLKEAHDIAPNWVEKIGRRTNYALRLTRQS